MWWAGNSVKNQQNLHISNPKPDLQYQCTCQVCENQLIFTQIIIWKENTENWQIQKGPLLNHTILPLLCGGV